MLISRKTIPNIVYSLRLSIYDPTQYALEVAAFYQPISINYYMNKFLYLSVFNLVSAEEAKPHNIPLMLLQTQTKVKQIGAPCAAGTGTVQDKWDFQIWILTNNSSKSYLFDIYFVFFQFYLFFLMCGTECDTQAARAAAALANDVELQKVINDGNDICPCIDGPIMARMFVDEIDHTMRECGELF